MAILFQCPWTNADAWLAALRAELPDVEFRVWPQTGGNDDIDFAYVFQPPAGALADLPHLRGIASMGAGVDAMIADPTIPADVPLSRLTDPILAERMAEYVAGQVLNFHLGLPAYRRQQAEKVWQRLPQTDAPARVVGFLGLGNLARRCIERLRPFGFRLVGWSRSGTPVDGVEVTTDLATVLRQAEILVLLVPVTDETRGLLSATRLALLPRGACLINVGRGALIDDKALLAALDSGHLAGAALDVFNPEPPPPEHRYWTHPLVEVTPHISSLSEVSSGARILAAQYRRVQAGEPMTDLVDRQRGY
ncbi:MAG: glyoxylate/hydroxypyruvate reductase A [Alphaproteobacteria bacterium]